MKYFLICLIFCSSLFAKNIKWGLEAHGYINEHAVDHLPAEMAFFKDHRNYLGQHSIDPDTDPLLGYYHYINIDYYPEFYTGTLPHNLDSLITIYDLSIVQDNGIVPWIIEEWTDSLSVLMVAGQWNDVWQIAAELGHYVADYHVPLHLTLNYDGHHTGNDGIYSRYQTQMINLHLSQLPLATGTGVYWSNVIDSVFLYIEEIYPYVDSILIADDIATAQDPNFRITYYNILWQELEYLTTISIHRAIIDLASLWRTAWENAGSPSPLSIQSNEHNPDIYFLAESYPNPFNPSTSIEFTIPKTEYVELKVYNILGKEVTTLVSIKLNQGNYTYQFDGKNLASGIYYYQLVAGEYREVRKMILLR